MKATNQFNSQIPRRAFLVGGATILGTAALRDGYLAASENSFTGQTREFKLDA